MLYDIQHQRRGIFCGHEESAASGDVVGLVGQGDEVDMGDGESGGGRVLFLVGWIYDILRNEMRYRLS